MGKQKSRKAAAQKARAPQQLKASAPQKMEAFTFGEPVPVLDKRDILDYVECISN
ncbi:Presumed portal vertex protein, partial [Salmonella enterica subsp. enterica]|nr:Presumed portal vertex protein [Salmonella enterica subsp. enterica]